MRNYRNLKMNPNCLDRLFNSAALVKSRLHVLVELRGCAMQGYRISGKRAARVYLSAAIMAALFATNVEAVTLSNVEGAITVNHGDGFQPASMGAALSSGDRVRAAASGSANIVYENGCSTRVGPHQVVVVLAAPPVCQGASLKDGPAVAPAAVASDTLVAGGLIVGTGVGLAIALSNNDNSSVSP